MDEILRCRRCILPASYPGIYFDEDGLCSLCREDLGTPKKPEKKPKEALDRIIEKYKGRNHRYDVIVGLSGGKDSSYVAYYLKKEYDLKILGFNFDIGYRSPYAVENLDNLSDKLEIDLMTLRPKKSLLVKLFAHFLRNRGEFCSVCNNLGYLIGASIVYNQSLLLGFSPLCAAGWSKQYEYQPGVSVTSMKYFFETLSPELFEELAAQPFIEKKVLQAFMRVEDPRQAQIGSEGHKKMGNYAINFVQIPDYIEWNIREIPLILASELGWKHPADAHESHFDCLLFPIKEFLKFKKYGLTQETIKNSVLIREGLMARDEAVQRISLEQTTEPEILDTFLHELEISRDEVNWESEWSQWI